MQKKTKDRPTDQKKTDQKDILAEYFHTQILTDRKVTVHQHAYPDRLPDRLFTVQDSTDR